MSLCLVVWCVFFLSHRWLVRFAISNRAQFDLNEFKIYVIWSEMSWIFSAQPNTPKYFETTIKSTADFVFFILPIPSQRTEGVAKSYNLIKSIVAVSMLKIAWRNSAYACLYHSSTLIHLTNEIMGNIELGGQTSCVILSAKSYHGREVAAFSGYKPLISSLGNRIEHKFHPQLFRIALQRLKKKHSMNQRHTKKLVHCDACNSFFYSFLI